MNKKHFYQFKTALAAVQLLKDNTETITTYEELQNVLNTFCEIINREASPKNNIPNKSIIAFKTYFEKEAGKKRDLKTISKKSTAKKIKAKISYKDFIPEYLILSSRGYSQQKIVDYSLKTFKVKVSKATIQKVLKNAEAEK